MEEKKEEMEYYTWKQFERDVEIISQQIKKRGWGLKNIYGLPRGGLILAVCLSHRLDVPLLLDSEKNFWAYSLVVDDIADTGKTLISFADYHNIVTLFYRRQSIVVPNIWLREKKKKWIHFPWEA